jgi:hypothetical protein
MGSPSHGRGSEGSGEEEAGSWRLRMGSEFHVPDTDRFHRQPPLYARIFGGSHGALAPCLSLSSLSHFLVSRNHLQL